MKGAQLLLFLFTSLIFLAGTIVKGQSNSKCYQLHNGITNYWKFLNEITNTVPGVPIKNFRKDVIDPYLEAYNSVAFAWLDNDSSLAYLMESLEQKTQEFHLVDSMFSLRMDKAWKNFQAYAPELKRGYPVFLLPAPRRAIGGSVRPLTKQNALIFGSEEISSVIESQTAFNVLVNHEMTHLYHLQVNREMREMVARVYMPPYAPGAAKIYQVLWLEGLAAFTSKRLNPSASDEQVLLSGTVASEVRALWPKIGTDLRKHLYSNKKVDIDKYLFDGKISTSFPRRAGYYIGMLIAAELSKKYSFAKLCLLSGGQLKAEVEGALIKLEKTSF